MRSDNVATKLVQSPAISSYTPESHYRSRHYKFDCTTKYSRAIVWAPVAPQVPNPRVPSGEAAQKTDPAPRKPIRRNLSACLPPENPQTAHQVGGLKGWMLSLQSTSDPDQATSGDPNMTFDVMDMDDQTAGNVTITIGTLSPSPESPSADPSVPSQVLCPLETTGQSQIPTKR